MSRLSFVPFKGIQGTLSNFTAAAPHRNTRGTAISAAPAGREQGVKPTGFNPTVHGARGLLALLVCIFHVARSGVPGFALQDLTLPHAALMSLQFGVEIFFCISGFIVVGALQRAATPGSFMLDRAIRILPVLWLTLAVLVPLGLATHQGVFAGLHVRDLGWILPANLLALAGVLPIPVLHLAAWSLSYELLFYITAAALWWLPAQQKAARFAVLAVATGLIIWHPRAVFFAVGMLVAKLDISRHRILGLATRAPGLALLAFMAVWYVVQFSNGSNGEDSAVLWVQDGRIGLAAIGISLAILSFSGIVAGHGVLGRLLRTRPFKTLGAISYSFYLWHLIVIAIAKRVMAMTGIEAHAGGYSQIVLLAVCLPISIVVAYASTQLVERRFAAWLKAKRASFVAPAAMRGAVAT